MKRKFLFFYVLVVMGLMSAYANNVRNFGGIRLPVWVERVLMPKKITEADVTPAEVKFDRSRTGTTMNNTLYRVSRRWDKLPDLEGSEERLSVPLQFVSWIDLGDKTDYNSGDTMTFDFPDATVLADGEVDVEFGFVGDGDGRRYPASVGKANIDAATKRVTITFNDDAKTYAEAVKGNGYNVGLILNISKTVEIGIGETFVIRHLDGETQRISYPDTRPVELNRDEVKFQRIGIMSGDKLSMVENFSNILIEGSTDNGPVNFALGYDFDFSEVKNIKVNASVVFPVAEPLRVETQEIEGRYGKFVLDGEKNTVTFIFSQRGMDRLQTETPDFFSRIPVKIESINDFETKSFIHLDGKTSQSITYFNNIPKDLSDKVKYENQRIDLKDKGGVTRDREISIAGLSPSVNVPFEYLGRINFEALNYNFKAGDYFSFPIPNDVSVEAGTYALGSSLYQGADDIATLEIAPVRREGKITLKENAKSFIETAKNQRTTFTLDYVFPAELKMVDGQTKTIVQPDTQTSSSVTYVVGKEKVDVELHNFVGIAEFGNYEYPKSFGVRADGNSDPSISYLYAGKFNIASLGRALKVGDYFEVPVPEPLIAEPASVTIIGEDGKLELVMNTDVENKKAVFTVTKLPANPDLLSGNYRIPVRLEFDPNIENERQEKDVPSPDGKSIQRVSWTYAPLPPLKGEENISKSGRVRKEEPDVIEWSLFINRKKDNLIGKNVVVKDGLSSSKVSEINYLTQSFEISSITYRNIENLNDKTYRRVNRIRVTEDENLFRTENEKNPNSYALLRWVNGRKGFNIDLGNQLGAEPYVVIYKTTSPRDGSIITNRASLLIDGTPVKPVELENKEDEPVGNEVSRRVYSPLRGGGDGNVESKPQIKIVKTDSEDENIKLQGAVFEIRQKNTIIETITTDANGEATSLALDEGIYQIVEKTAPSGYILDTQVRNIEVFNGQGIVDVEISNVREKSNQAEQNTPIGEIVETLRGVVPEAKGSIYNVGELPVGTEYSWEKAPDVSSIGLKEAEVRITYPNDGTFDLVPVKVYVYERLTQSPRPRVEVSPTGLVGVNTDKPQAMLDVRYVESSKVSKVFDVREQSGQSRLSLTKEGNLGLNKENPTAKLHIRQENNSTLDASILSFQNISKTSRVGDDLSRLLTFVDVSNKIYGSVATKSGELGIVGHSDKGLPAVLRTEEGRDLDTGNYSQITTIGSGVNRILFEVKTGQTVYKTLVQHQNHWYFGGANVDERREVKERVVVEGAVRVGTEGIEKKGTIIYKDGHLQVYDGTRWVNVNND